MSWQAYWQPIAIVDLIHDADMIPVLGVILLCGDPFIAGKVCPWLQDSVDF